MSEGRPLGVYLHIPFCLRKCSYCDFLSLPTLSYHPYLSALQREIERYQPLLSERELVSLYIGGGTPTLIPPVELDHLLRKTAVPSSAEITLEANPGTLTEEMGLRLTQAGFNRISLGIQSLRNWELKTLGRIHNATEAKEAFRIARRSGFANINCDLIFGIPDQGKGDFLLSLMEMLDFAPEHLSLYALSLERGTPLARAVASGQACLPNDDEVAEMYEAACQLLRSAGFEHYEISNFARPGYQCRHNKIYWHSGEYLGMGLGAVSFLDGTRWKNTHKLDDYCSSLERGEFPITSRIGKRGMAALREEMILALRTSAGFSEQALRTRYPRAYARMRQRLEELKAEGWIEEKNGHWMLPERHFFISNQVFVRLL
jgi:oxygen-independent coproporphyrinogen-3 oxidase